MSWMKLYTCHHPELQCRIKKLLKPIMVPSLSIMFYYPCSQIWFHLFSPDKVNTSTNFHAKADTGPMIRFVRVSYVRPKYGLPPGGLTVPRVITYKTFLPAATGRAVIDITPEFEPMTSLWERVRNWLQESGDSQFIFIKYLLKFLTSYTPTLLIKASIKI